MEHHPSGNRLTQENLDLKAELKRVRASAGKEDAARQLEHSHRYTLQLEKQLRHYLARGNISECSKPSIWRSLSVKRTMFVITQLSEAEMRDQ